MKLIGLIILIASLSVLNVCVSNEEKSVKFSYSEAELLTKERAEQFFNFRIIERTELPDKILKEKIIKFYSEFNGSSFSKNESCQIPIFKIDKKDKEDVNTWKNKTPVWCDIEIVDGRDLREKKARILYHIIRNKNEFSIAIAMIYIPNNYEGGESYYLQYIPEIEQAEGIAKNHFKTLSAYLKKKGNL